MRNQCFRIVSQFLTLCNFYLFSFWLMPYHSLHFYLGVIRTYVKLAFGGRFGQKYEDSRRG
jgi:hypothetical protein